MITAEAVIDLNALRNNFALLKSHCDSDTKVIAVLKGDAYGHNAIQVARALPNADMFAVSRIEEAIELRSADILQPILLLEGCFCPEDLQLAAQLSLHTTIHCIEQLQDFEQTPLTQHTSVWLKLDTGMHRLGVQADEINTYVTRLEKSGKIAGNIGFISHFSCADIPSSHTTPAQLERFKTQTQAYQGMKTLANSAGILYWPESHFDAVRAGIALYGIAPNVDEIGQHHHLTPVMTLQSRLIAVRRHQANQPVGYGENWTSDRETYIGVIAMGYGDGYPRSAPNGTPVYINGRIVPISGRISMDMITVDLGPDATDQVGDCVELWGQHVPIEQVAKLVGTIPYELVIQLTRRVARTFINE
ncbi:Alanine racemase, biosynthetic [Vibrio ruber DSM 16370]|uniref:Alanine racemase n=1 Tax=Vibrio ruber (strain DSM 16370 / JCM 11486 / BCRC 17186 / CECT 7878 / LMG 23124 / VR1) TaxID=1123498 RepID=A0A1R4LCN9_VIBR1|nr:alanine racemase [Vibrio ruber]SJN54340.1 Alanine racemase, biosynthetic [Vibrio ruber DSM 16370]